MKCNSLPSTHQCNNYDVIMCMIKGNTKANGKYMASIHTSTDHYTTQYCDITTYCDASVYNTTQAQQLIQLLTARIQLTEKHFILWLHCFTTSTNGLLMLTDFPPVNKNSPFSKLSIFFLIHNLSCLRNLYMKTAKKV